MNGFEAVQTWIDEMVFSSDPEQIQRMADLAWKITAQKIMDKAYREGKLSHIGYKN